MCTSSNDKDCGIGPDYRSGFQPSAPLLHETQGYMAFALRAKAIPPWAGIGRAYSALRLRRRSAGGGFGTPRPPVFRIQIRNHDSTTQRADTQANSLMLCSIRHLRRAVSLGENCLSTLSTTQLSGKRSLGTSVSPLYILREFALRAASSLSVAYDGG